MDDLISREDVIALLNKWADGYSYIETPTADAVKKIEGLPSIDAVPVVRCEDCKCKDKYENFCWRFLREIDPSDYCSYAEGKEE